MKARIVPHGNRDAERDNIRKDTSNARLMAIRVILSLTTFLNFSITTVDVKGAYLQSGPISHDIYVRPPWEWRGSRGMLWRLLKFAYGIAESGRQWQVAVEQWMLVEYELKRVFGLSQFFIKRNAGGKIIMFVVKVTDDFLISGTNNERKDLVEALGKRFELSKITHGKRNGFNGCEIEIMRNGDVTMSMTAYMKRLRMLDITPLRRKDFEQPSTAE